MKRRQSIAAILGLLLKRGTKAEDNDDAPIRDVAFDFSRQQLRWNAGLDKYLLDMSKGVVTRGRESRALSSYEVEKLKEWFGVQFNTLALQYSVWWRHGHGEPVRSARRSTK